MNGFFTRKGLWLLALLVLPFALAKAAVSEENGTITGSVTNTGQPLAGVTISIAGHNKAVRTNDKGSYQLSVKPGQYKVVASYIGFITQQKEITVTSGQATNVDFALEINTSQLRDVVVVSSRTPQQISNIPGTVWVIDSTRLQSQIKAGVTFKEALGILIPGIDLGGQGRTNTGQNLRGREVLVMIDGVSLNSTRGVSRQFDAIDPFNIEKIEVLSGASAIYGGGASGGIVNIITKKGTRHGVAFETEIGGRSGLGHSDDHDLRIAQSVSAGNEKINGRIGTAFQKNGAAYDANSQQIKTDITQTDLQYNRSIDLFANGNWRINAKQSLRVAAQYYDSRFDGNKGLYLGPDLSGAFKNKPELIAVKEGWESDVNPASKRAMGNLNYHISDVLGHQDIYVQAFGRSERFNFYPFPGTLSYVDAAGAKKGIPNMGASSQNTDLYGFKLVLAKKWRTVHVNYGIDGDHENFESRQTYFDPATSYASGGLVNKTLVVAGRYPHIGINSIAGFAQAGWDILPRLSLSAGIRQQRIQVKVDDFVDYRQQALMAMGVGTTADAVPGGEKSYNVTSFNGGLVFKATDHMQTWLNFSEGFSLADPAKYYGTGSYKLQGQHWALQNGASVGTSPLSGIKTHQFEAGWRWKQHGWNAQTALFYTRSNKNIQYVPATLTLLLIDQPRRNYGIEGAVSYDFNNGIEAGTNFLFIKSENKNNGSWQKQTVTDASPSKVVSFAGWHNNRFNVRLQDVQSFRLTDDAGNQLSDYNTLDLIAAVKLPFGKLTAGVQNLLNRDYQSIWSQRAQVYYKALSSAATYEFMGRGRTYSLTYTISY
ncbi:TonB-dependent receptor [Chitinophaga nivalis]|uniref:TonB-dependent receptor n=1 Tax=Chitinophaga nivalis TaxID=2991709 RepID=A0ABT3IQ44_9BACT|nr:TonB-dependent receptor [Chitinophaga nivalis]MCW3464233.1 TonB-dependent receptor [Chitinophaga nivalis]MCW3486077.1 TonB-dependent receptor [Chitinophaga nivalis]